MKKTIYIATAFVAAVSLAACTSDMDYLTEKPKTIYTVDNAFEKSSQVDAQLVRCYDELFVLHGWCGGSDVVIFGAPGSTLSGYGADCIEGNGQASSAATAFSNYASLNALNGRFYTLWNELYQVASYANLALYGAEQVNWSSNEDKAYAVAQAKFFVGWSYLRLGECFGGVPIVKEFNQDLRFDYTRNTRQEVYQYAIDCFTEAAAGLPDYPRQDGRLSATAAQHYLAEAYIAQGVETGDNSCYTKAIAAADYVISRHPLMTSRFGVRANPADTGYSDFGTSYRVANYKEDGNVFYDLFQIGNYDRSEGNTESVWVMQAATFEQYASSGGYRQTGYGYGQPMRDIQFNDAFKEPGANGPWQGRHDESKYPNNGSSFYHNGGSWGMFGSTDYSDEYIYRDQFADDMRNSQVVLISPVITCMDHSMYGQPVTKDMILEPARYMRNSCKVMLADGWGYNAHHSLIGQNWQEMWGRDWYAARSSETYLLKAEAQLRGGDAAAAAATLNVVRQRAQCSYLYDTVTIYDILDERARELIWEEQRWPTLLRMAKQGEDNEVMHHQLLTHAMYVHDYPYFTGTISWSLFPIPQQVIDLNTDAVLEQNKGW